jgi:two-component system sensor histidine kinase YesM
MESAEKYLTSFSRLVRYTLDNSEVQEITLEEELNALKSYAELEMQRFDNGFDFSIHCSEKIDQVETVLPSMVLQPYLENAIKHGINRTDLKGKISIDVKRTNENILIAIEDNGVGIPESYSATHSNSTNPHGTTINAERIKAYNRLFKKKIVTRIINLKNGDGVSKGTRVEIEFNEQ